MIDVPKWSRTAITKREYREELLETLESLVYIEKALVEPRDQIELAKLSTQIVTELYVLDNESPCEVI